MDAFADRLARLAELSPEEIDALETELVAAFDAADSSGDVDLMQALADALDTVRAAKTATPPEAPPAPGQAAPVAAAADVLDRPLASDDPTQEPEVPVDPQVPVPAEPDPTAPPADPADVPEAAVPDDDEILKALVNVTKAELEALAALPEEDRVALAQMAAPNPPVEQPVVVPDQPEQEEAVATEVVTQSDVPDANKPVPVTAAAIPYTITAGGDIPGVTSGQALTDMDEVIEAMTKKVNAMRGVGGDGEYVIVASLRRDEDAIDEDKMLRKSDPEGNSAKIRKFLQENESRASMVAAGWCAPRTPLYDIPGIGSTDTPVADSLASFGVDRGGIIWTEPPSLGGVISSLGANAFVRWTPGNAAGTVSQTGVVAPGAATNPVDTKPCIDISCGVERSADLIALPMCLCFDLLSSRTNPEFVKAATDLVQVAQAHFKEQWLLASLFGAPGVVNTPATVGTPDVALGIARDWLIQIRLVASQFRWRNRLSATQQLRVYAPAWLRDAVAADLMVQAPGDDTMSTSYAEVDGYLDDCNVDPVWYIDDVPVMAGATAPITAASNFDSYLGWATPAEWLITSPGVFTRLDGGQVDLGVVRTKDDIQKNKFCEFAETFESVAYMGPQTAANAWAIRGTTPVIVLGGHNAGQTIAATGIVAE